jgi:4-hydroxythreonine-4-phosphate dehydrogenase
MSTSSPIALTCGDPAGIGPGLIARLLENDGQGLVPIGPACWIRGLPVPGLAVGPDDFEINPGKPSAEGHRVALAAMERAAEGCRNGEFSAVVTGPVSKSGLASVGFRHPGQTEFFAERWGGIPVMAFAGGRMAVALATWHIPLSEVSRTLDGPSVIRAGRALDALLKRRGKASPRIGICGLNPHAGEDGLLGVEDARVIRPAVDALREAGIEASGPHAGDTAFARHLAGEFDGIVAMFHDQGLGPLKTVDFAEAANLTLGLPWIRTSPDHGTAYALAGKGTADGRSLASAVRLARELATR